MSYAVRNSLILLVVLVLIVAGGWSYIQFIQLSQIEKLEKQLGTKRQELQRKQEVANQYSTVLRQFEQATDFYNNYEKTLYQSSNEDDVFAFINQLNSGAAFTDFNFVFNDSLIQGEYGIINMQIDGEGYYRYFVNLIRKIEYSKPLNKVKFLSVTPINNLEDYGRVSFSFALESYYDRSQLLEQPRFDIYQEAVSSLYNPFYPLIREVKPNEDNLTDIENSNLFSMSSDRVFLIDQNGEMQQLAIGDEVYLGTLSKINLKERTATFQLNKGGIIELVTLEVNQ